MSIEVVLDAFGRQQTVGQLHRHAGAGLPSRPHDDALTGVRRSRLPGAEAHQFAGQPAGHLRHRLGGDREVVDVEEQIAAAGSMSAGLAAPMKV